MSTNRITVFTKPWKSMSAEGLAELVSEIGADGIELPIRPGYQVEPITVLSTLPKTRAVFDRHNLSISSAAGSLEEATIRALGDSGIPLLRVCIPIDMKQGYMASVQNLREKILNLGPVLEASGVKVGIQNHYGFMIGSALGIAHLLDGISEDQACAVLDFAHCALDGEPVEMAVDIVKQQLGLVNFKNACRVRTTGPDDEAEWQVLWTTGRHGGYSWQKAVSALRNIRYVGDICLPAEYNRIGVYEQLMDSEVIPRIRSDIQYLREILESENKK